MPVEQLRELLISSVHVTLYMRRFCCPFCAVQMPVWGCHFRTCSALDGAVLRFSAALDAAHEAGERAGREAAVKVARSYPDWCSGWGQMNNQATAQTVSEEIAAAIRGASHE